MQIDKNVPVPSDIAGRGKRSIFADMVPGDSIFFPNDNITTIVSRAGAWVRNSKNGWKFTSRTVTENGVKGVRCWRIA